MRMQILRRNARSDVDSKFLDPHIFGHNAYTVYCSTDDNCHVVLAGLPASSSTLAPFQGVLHAAARTVLDLKPPGECLRVKADMVLFAGNTVCFIPERVRGVREDTLYKYLYLIVDDVEIVSIFFYFKVSQGSILTHFCRDRHFCNGYIRDYLINKK